MSKMLTKEKWKYFWLEHQKQAIILCNENSETILDCSICFFSSFVSSRKVINNSRIRATPYEKGTQRN
jgi:hypothetical protein